MLYLEARSPARSGTDRRPAEDLGAHVAAACAARGAPAKTPAPTGEPWIELSTTRPTTPSCATRPTSSGAPGRILWACSSAPLSRVASVHQRELPWTNRSAASLNDNLSHACSRCAGACGHRVRRDARASGLGRLELGLDGRRLTEVPIRSRRMAARSIGRLERPLEIASAPGRSRDWGTVDEDAAMATLHAAATPASLSRHADYTATGVRSGSWGATARRAIGVTVATKMVGGWTTVGNYSPENFRGGDRSRETSGRERSTSSSCLPRRPLYEPEVFATWTRWSPSAASPRTA